MLFSCPNTDLGPLNDTHDQLFTDLNLPGDKIGALARGAAEAPGGA